MRVLITGGAGFIGSHLAALLQDRAEVRILDNLRSGHRQNLDGLEVDFIEGSILDPAALAKAVSGVDYVLHLAAFISVPESMQDPITCVRINTEGTLLVLRAAADAGVRKLCLSSSAAVYGNDASQPAAESASPAPMSPYAVSKLDGEYYCRIFAEQGWLQTVALRYFNVFGPRQDPNSAYAAAIPLFVSRALSGQDIGIFGDGGQTRDFVYVEDVARANAHVLFSDVSGVFNVAYGQGLTINALAAQIVALTGSRSRIVHLPERPGDIRHSVADVSKLRDTGFKRSGNLADGLAATVAYFAAQG